MLSTLSVSQYTTGLEPKGYTLRYGGEIPINYGDEIPTLGYGDGIP